MYICWHLFKMNPAMFYFHTAEPILVVLRGSKKAWLNSDNFFCWWAERIQIPLNAGPSSARQQNAILNGVLLTGRWWLNIECIQTSIASGGGVNWGNFGTSVRVSFFKPTPVIYLVFEKKRPIHRLDWTKCLHIHIPFFYFYILSLLSVSKVYK